MTTAAERPTVEQHFRVHALAAAELRDATNAAAVLRRAGEQLLAQAAQTHADAVTPILRMLGVPEGNITEVEELEGQHFVTVIVPAPADSIPTPGA